MERLNGRKTIGILMLCVILMTALFSVQVSASSVDENTNPNPHVLFISSYSLSFESVLPQIEGIQESLGDNYNLDMEFMDGKRFAEEVDFEHFAFYLKDKMSKLPIYDAIIVGDDLALRFAMDHKEELFPDVPLVFLGINSIELAEEAEADPLITGVVEAASYKENIELALQLWPSADEVVAIVDNTPTGQGDQQQFRNIQSEFPDVKFREINASELTRKELLEELEKIDINDICFFLTMSNDKDQNYYSIEDGVSLLVQNVQAPIFRLSIGGVGQGVVGGIMVSYDRSGRLAADMVKRIIHGTLPTDIPMITTSPNYGLFDQDMLDFYEMDKELLPAGTEIINQKPTFYEANKHVIQVCVVFAIIAFFVFWVLFLNNRRKKEQLNRDYLTGLHTRMWMMKHIAQIISKGQDCTVIMLDVDNFKKINDSQGHLQGDELLVQIAKRVKALDRPGLEISRFGGDEFLGVLHTSDLMQADICARQIMSIFEEPFMLNNLPVEAHASMGVATASGGNTTVDEVVAQADMALYSVKRKDKNAYKFYDQQMMEAFAWENKVEDMIKEAIKEDGFDVVYQPQYTTDTRKLAGMEALVRLKNGKASPAEFIPIAEKNGSIHRIGRIVTEKVIRQMAKWKEKGYLYPVAINFSSKQIQDEKYPQFVHQLLKTYDIEPQYLEIEITESVFMERSEEAIAYLESFYEEGISLALDDFGTGYSAINYLNYVPISKLKIDKSLIDEYRRNHDTKMVEAIVDMAKHLGLAVVAEGVEDEDEAAFIRSIQCEYIQGYLFGKPMSAEDMEKTF